MGTIMSVSVIFLIKKLTKLNQEINGKWFAYLTALISLLWRRRSTPKGRFDLHSIWKSDVRHLGHVPFDQEWLFDRTSKVCLNEIILNFKLLFFMEKGKYVCCYEVLTLCMKFGDTLRESTIVVFLYASQCF